MILTILAGLKAAPLEPPTKDSPKIVNPIAKGANPVFDCGVDAYNVNPLESDNVLMDIDSTFCLSASSNATVNATSVS